MTREAGIERLRRQTPEQIDAVRNEIAMNRVVRDERQGHGTPFSDLFK